MVELTAQAAHFQRRFGADAVTGYTDLLLAVCLQAGLAIVLVWVSQLRELLGYIGFTLGVTAALTVIGLLRLRAIEGPERIPIPGYPWVPWMFVLSTFGASSVMFLRQPLEAGLGLVTILGGLPIYWLLSKRQR